MSWIRKFPTPMLAIIAIMMAIAPFPSGDAPWQPHLWEKINMLMQGDLRRPIDILDLIMHSTPLVLLVLKLTSLRGAASESDKQGE